MRGAARLLQLAPELAEDLLYRRKAFHLALACRALGIDKSVFASVFAQTRAAVGAPMLLSPHDKQECDRVFASLDAPGAQAKIASALGTPASA